MCSSFSANKPKGDPCSEGSFKMTARQQDSNTLHQGSDQGDSSDNSQRHSSTEGLNVEPTPKRGKLLRYFTYNEQVVISCSFLFLSLQQFEEMGV